MSNLLKFGKGNAKLGKDVYTFSLPSGYTCPNALECLSKSDRITGKITDGKETKFRCFSASQEALYKNVRESRWYNFDLLKNSVVGIQENTAKMLAMKDLISNSLPKKSSIIRIHVAGDFFSQIYFDAWAMVAATFTNKIFYFYTKSLPFWVARLNLVGNGHKKDSLQISNFIPTASYGGRNDDLIEQYNLRSSKVVFTEQEAKKLKLEIDHDDTHAMKVGKDFALLLHGTQPAGTMASEALQKLKAEGKGGYSKKIPLKTL